MLGVADCETFNAKTIFWVATHAVNQKYKMWVLIGFVCRCVCVFVVLYVFLVVVFCLFCCLCVFSLFFFVLFLFFWTLYCMFCCVTFCLVLLISSEGLCAQWFHYFFFIYGIIFIIHFFIIQIFIFLLIFTFYFYSHLSYYSY